MRWARWFWGLRWWVKWPIVVVVALIVLGAVLPSGEEDGGERAETAAASPSPAPSAVAEATAAGTAVVTPASAPSATPTPAPTRVATATPSPTPAPTATPTAAPTAAPSPAATVLPEVVALVERLRGLVGELEGEGPEYERDEFAGWRDADGDCLDTRQEVLAEEAVGGEYELDEEGCRVLSGEWHDPFTGRWFTDPRELDVDHVVALADAWRSGAWMWEEEARDAFANDPANLNAIERRENQERKGAWGPADYSPANGAHLCAYLWQYATVKAAYELAITRRDFEAVAEGLAGCASVEPAAPSAARE